MPRSPGRLVVRSNLDAHDLDYAAHPGDFPLTPTSPHRLSRTLNISYSRRWDKRFNAWPKREYRSALAHAPLMVTREAISSRARSCDGAV